LPGPGNEPTQIHDLNPTAFPPVGLFWTIEIPVHHIEVQLDKGRACMRGFHIPVFDYGTGGNALFAGGPPPVRGLVSFKAVWSGAGEKVHIKNTDPVFGGFEGDFIRNSAQMEWRAIVDGYVFESDPLETSTSAFAEIGHERNGSFFQCSDKS
jgi:hypothetical protein